MSIPSFFCHGYICVLKKYINTVVTLFPYHVTQDLLILYHSILV